ncbi:MAG: hypothetical protein QHH05_03455 [Syntrophomonadaceae bacterium]|nr:hypothetical protein [Syntrophomonadaceae bacterium]
MTTGGLYDGAAVRKVLDDRKVYDDFEVEDYGLDAEEEEITVYDVDVVLGYSTDILKMGIYSVVGALVIGVIFLVVQYL